MRSLAKPPAGWQRRDHRRRQPGVEQHHYCRKPSERTLRAEEQGPYNPFHCPTLAQEVREDHLAVKLIEHNLLTARAPNPALHGTAAQNMSSRTLR